jgi:hypothetical protein
MRQGGYGGIGIRRVGEENACFDRHMGVNTLGDGHFVFFAPGDISKKI